MIESSLALRPRLTAFALVAVAGLTLAASQASAATGSDGGYGYTWRDSNDGALSESIAWDAPLRFTPADNDPPMGPIDMGFASGFEFYGNPYNNIWISDNGWISFSATADAAPIPSPMGNGAGPNEMLAFAWRELIVAPGRITHGRSAARDAFRVQFTGFTPAVMDVVQVDVLFFSDGRIKYQYAVAPPADVTVGIESAAGGDFFQIAHDGVREDGVVFADGYVIEILPPAVLPPTCGGIPIGACGQISASSPAGGTNVSFYGCDTAPWLAQEAVYAFELTEASEVNLSLTAGTALQFFLLSECNERSCLAGPTLATTQLLGAGVYYVAVDGPTPADEGSFVLDVICTPIGETLGCPDTFAGSTGAGVSRWDSYPCTGGLDHGGPEIVHSVQIAAATNMRVSLDSATGPADVMVLRSGPGILTAADCVAWGDNGTVVWDAQPGEYLVVVDGPLGASADYQISTACGVTADCGAPAGTIDFASGRVLTVSGDTTGLPNVIEVYGCDPAAILDGGEEIWEVVLDQPGQIAMSQTQGTPVQFSLLSSCNEGACISSDEASSCGTMLDAGTYYLVVDSAAGGETPYELLAMFEESFNRWDACELPVLPDTTLETECSPFWNLSDEAFCKYNCADFTSCDPDGAPCADGSACAPNPLAVGVDCVFAMYVTVDCGTELHLPFYDAEGGHVRIFDIFNGVYLDLEARSPTWAQSGTEIQWQDADCGSGSDGRWNEVVTDVSFQRITGLCGIFRLEFINHSGNVWELFANCDGSRLAGFNICDNLCTALGGYAPLPNLSIVSVDESYNCPEVSVTYEVRNDGCVPARDVEVELQDGGTLFVDLIPEIQPGETVLRSFTSPVPTPSGTLLLSVDPNDTVLECDEAGGRSSCEVISGTDIQELLGCAATCAVDVRTTVAPDAVCVGDPTPVVLDACSTVFQACSGLEYAYIEVGSGMAPVFGPECSWTVDPPPTATTTYSLIARCLDDPDCNDFETVTVTVQRQPDIDAASVVARDQTNCNLNILISWLPATFYGPSGEGVYNIYRSATGCDTGLGVVQLGIVDDGTMTEFEYIDTPPLADTPYYYVVEAEDDSVVTSCLPPGPHNGGSATRVSASGGVCTAVIDTLSPAIDMLPRVGQSLRVGGTDPTFGARQYSETFVQMFWTPDRDADPLAIEHFHVYRSDQPDVNFSTVTDDAPPETANEFLDPLSDHLNDGQAHVWFYLIFTADACEGENTDFDRFCSDC